MSDEPMPVVNDDGTELLSAEQVRDIYEKARDDVKTLVKDLITQVSQAHVDAAENPGVLHSYAMKMPEDLLDEIVTSLGAKRCAALAALILQEQANGV